MKLICETCREWIGNFDEGKVKLPLTAEMFRPIREALSHHPPFRTGTTAEWFRCPVCNKRPFHLDDTLLTDEGYVRVPVATQDAASEPEKTAEPAQPDAIVCQVCGREFTKRIALLGHMRSHK